MQLVAYSERTKGRRTVLPLPLDDGHDGFLPGWLLRQLADQRADVVGVVVMQDDPTETVTEQAPYALRVNGVLQPGG